MLKPAAERTAVSECMVLCTACAIKINVNNGNQIGYGTFVKIKLGTMEK